MRETFPPQRQGDLVSANQLDKSYEAARRLGAYVPGTHLRGQQGGTFIASMPYPTWTQTIVEITSETIDDDDTEDSGLYLCRMRYQDGSRPKSENEGGWESQKHAWRLDATGLGMTFDVGEVLNAYWHEQRGMFVPIIDTNPLMETEGATLDTLAALSVENGYWVEYWLERRPGTKGAWTCINKRRWYLNVYFETLGDVRASGVGFVTFRARNADEIRLVARLGNSELDIDEVQGIIKIEALKMGGIKTFDEPSGEASVVRDMTVEAEVNNVDGVVARPKFESVTAVEYNDAIRITTPGAKDWTVEATFAITVISEATSTSHTSTSSISTSSTSLSSVSPSSVSTSSSSISTSSLSISSISTSSSSVSTSSISTSSISTSSSSESSGSSPSSVSTSSSSTSTSSGSEGDDCAFCQGSMPATIPVQLTGIVECAPDGCPNGDCTELNTSHTLVQVLGGNGCRYRVRIDACGIGYGAVHLDFLSIPGNKVRVQGRVYESDILSAKWQKDIDADEEGEIDCNSIGELNLVSFVDCGPDEGQAFCIYSGATFTV